MSDGDYVDKTFVIDTHDFGFITVNVKVSKRFKNDSFMQNMTKEFFTNGFHVDKEDPTSDKTIRMHCPPSQIKSISYHL